MRVLSIEFEAAIADPPRLPHLFTGMLEFPIFLLHLTTVKFFPLSPRRISDRCV